MNTEKFIKIGIFDDFFLNRDSDLLQCERSMVATLLVPSLLDYILLDN